LLEPPSGADEEEGILIFPQDCDNILLPPSYLTTPCLLIDCSRHS